MNYSMEWKIGEIKQINGEWYQCIRSSDCPKCDLKIIKDCRLKFPCESLQREDCEEVIFKKLEKVGEPYFNGQYGKVLQEYKYYIPPITPDLRIHIIKLGIVGIEIKQNKEDMEEKKQCDDNRFEVIEKAKRHLLHSTNIESNKEEMKLLDVFLLRCWQMGWLDSYDDTKHSNSEKIGKNLKPFDLEAAKAGKPVCTRDGRKARIICFDLQSIENTPIVAAVQVTDKQEVIANYYEDGRQFVDGISDLDLMMLPRKERGMDKFMAT